MVCDGAALSHVKRRSVVVLFTIAGATLLLCVAHIVVGWFLLLQRFMKSLFACLLRAKSTNQATSVQCLRLPEGTHECCLCIVCLYYVVV